MSKSYQHEIPLARVNITLDVESNGSKSKKELPMKLLMLGDFSHGQALGPISRRERVNINKQNFNHILASLAPKLKLSVKNQLSDEPDDLNVALEIRSLQDFKPEHIVEQVPKLQRLMAMRNLLKDLKSSVIDNQAFRKALEKIMQNSNEAQKLLSHLSKDTL
ncbi:type VI secretion system contractile sheath small subunit [Legionella impletisoli]|uniref:Type VI secretion system-associated protein n=1 Tax=Legionella impletisoli TaxID=343510 RepID=A0A917ND87_9GAMM|nr:type VI secretion system contractile sheath small subunit [Legionella impletisoli]GGI89834.1 type VI secretion system-associated protein [Legionella impletisoli]